MPACARRNLNEVLQVFFVGLVDDTQNRNLPNHPTNATTYQCGACAPLSAVVVPVQLQQPQPTSLIVTIADMTEGAEGSTVDAGSNAANGCAASSQLTSSLAPPPISSPTTIARKHEELVAHAREHYTKLGYRVHSGLQFGCELVLYADHPQFVHSDFCVLVLPADGRVDWRRIQCLTRSMPDYKKTLILAEVVVTEEDGEQQQQQEEDNDRDTRVEGEDDVSSSRADDSIIGLTKEKKKKRIIKVNELAVSTEHAPFRHRSAKKGAVDIGSQRKKQKTSA